MKWLPDCSNELDFNRIRTLSQELGRNNLKFIPAYYSYFHYPERHPDIIRRIYKPDERIKSEDLKTKKAVSIIKWGKNIVENNDLLINQLKGISECFKTKTEINKVSILPTNGGRNFQFTLFDHIKSQRGNKSGYTMVTNSNTQATDINQDIDSPIHMEISFTESINLINLLGCIVGIKLFPIYDAPNEDTLDKIRKNIENFSLKYNCLFEDYSSLKLNGIFFGTTATGNTHKELPNRYDLVKKDMQIILTDSLGLLSCLSLYLISNISEKLYNLLNREGIDEYTIKQLRDLSIKNMTEPKTNLGKTVSKFLPDFENGFDLNSHIIVTHPVSKRGISSLEEISQLTNCELIIHNTPLADKRIIEFASKELIVSNPTASTSNTNIIIASKELSSSILDDLTKNKFNPNIIGKIGEKGKRGVIFNNNNNK